MRIYPKKSLGQNFLVDKNISGKIVSLLGFNSSDIVLEIGAGRGELSSLIAPCVKKIYCLEIDKRLIPLLLNRMKDFDNASVINSDILKFNLGALSKEEGKIKVFGNIPYYISSPIIEYLIKHKSGVTEAFITVQKEFARRVVAKPGSKEYGSLSIFVQYHAAAEIILKISKGCFYPAPKVDSSLLRLSFYRKPAVFVRNEELFFKVVRSAFTQRRKTLINSLRNKAPLEQVKSFLEEHNKSVKSRPEELSLREFADLVETLS